MSLDNILSTLLSTNITLLILVISSTIAITSVIIVVVRSIRYRKSFNIYKNYISLLGKLSKNEKNEFKDNYYKIFKKKLDNVVIKPSYEETMKNLGDFYYAFSKVSLKEKDLQNSIEAYTAAIKKISDSVEYAKISQQLGKAYNEISKYSESFKYYIKSLQALQKIRNDVVHLNYTIPLLQDSNAKIREATLSVISKLGEKKYLDYVFPLLKDSNGEVRKEAEKTIAKIESK